MELHIQLLKIFVLFEPCWARILGDLELGEFLDELFDLLLMKYIT